MAKKVGKITREADPTKKMVNDLTESIKAQRALHTSTEVKDGDLFVPKAKFNSKALTKYNYRQLSGLYEYMQANPDKTDDEIRTVIHKNKAEFVYLVDCDFVIPNFVEDLRANGVDYIVEKIEGKTL